MAYSEEDIVSAVFDVTDNGFSQRKAAEKWGVPQATISRRLSGRGAQADQIQPESRLSKDQEELLTDWILKQESVGYAPSYSQVHTCAVALLKSNGDEEPLGKNWVARYRERTARLKAKLGIRREASRFNGFTPKSVNWYFDIREGQYGWIKPENTVNVDKGGIMAGMSMFSI